MEAPAEKPAPPFFVQSVETTFRNGPRVKTKAEQKAQLLNRLKNGTPKQPEPILEPDDPQGTIIHALGSRKVIRLTGEDSDKVVKIGKGIQPFEAAAMRYVAEHTTIPVPRVFEEKTGPEKTSITMSYIEGQTLETVWSDLSPEQKLNIALQTRAIIEQLRSLRRDDTYIGGVDGGPAIDRRRWGSIEGGPFETEELFNEFLISNKRSSSLTLWDETSRKLLNERTHDICFTHGDLAPRNIIVKDGRITGVIDWEYSGWYPEYWEFAKSMTEMSAGMDWHQYYNQIFPQKYQKEFATQYFISAMLRH